MNRFDVAIVGAGANGLYLGASFAKLGLSVTVLERRVEPTRHSRAIGIHPPGLEALEEIGAAAALLDAGVHVQIGHATAGDTSRGLTHLGTLSFSDSLRGAWPFVLTVPQHRTEAVLEARLEEFAPAALHRGVEVLSWQERSDVVQLSCSDGVERSASLLVACTGATPHPLAHRDVRTKGGRYGDTYLMVDVPQQAEHFGRGSVSPLPSDEALIHLAPDGVVEAFPLPGKVRRWVAKTTHLQDPARAEDLAELVAQRTGVTLDATQATMVSSFGVQRRLATPLARGRVWLAGDAAHVVAPIGGQGMTLGWLGGRDLVSAWSGHLEGESTIEEACLRYDRQQRRRTRQAMERAAWNLRMGRATRTPALRSAIVRVLLREPFATRMARVFTMQEA